eukprot:7382742-Prymnesium_polylepis.1
MAVAAAAPNAWTRVPDGERQKALAQATNWRDGPPVAIKYVQNLMSAVRHGLDRGEVVCVPRDDKSDDLVARKHGVGEKVRSHWLDGLSLSHSAELPVRKGEVWTAAGGNKVVVGAPLPPQSRPNPPTRVYTHLSNACRVQT